MYSKLRQMLFDRSLAHIRAQGGPAMSDEGACRYRTYDGRSCAAAPFINQYDPEMEGGSFGDLCGRWAHTLDLGAVAERDFVYELQRVHDRSALRGCAERGSNTANPDFMSDWEAGMAEIAAKFELNYRPPGS